MLSNPSWRLLLCSFMVLVGSIYLPLEESLNGTFLAKIYFPLKVVLIFTALCVPVMSTGVAVKILLNRVIFSKLGGLFPESPKERVWDLMLNQLSIGLMGLCLLGMFYFLLGQWLAPDRMMAFLCLVPGYLMIAFHKGFEVYCYKEVKEIVANISLVLASATKIEKVFYWFLFVVLVLKYSTIFRFQQQGDLYLYYLSLADDWIREGHTGIVLHNILSGYALAIVHFFGLLKVLFVGYSEHSSLATGFSGVFGLGTMIVAAIAILRTYLSRNLCILMIFFLLQSTYAYASLQARTDGFLGAVVLGALASQILGHYRLFVFFAFSCLMVKITGATTFLSLGLLALIWPMSLEGLKNNLLRYVIAAVVMIFAWLPFAYHNYAVTSNPFYPLLNEVFPNNFAPAKNVVLESAPLTLSFMGYIRACIELFQKQTIYLMVLILCGLLLFVKPLRMKVGEAIGDKRNLLFLFCFAMINFLFLQLIFVEYDNSFTSRHYYPVFIALNIICFVLFFAILNSTKLKRYSFTIMLVICISRVAIDVNVLELIHYTKVKSQVKDIQERRPMLAVNQFLEDYLQKPEVNRGNIFSFDQNTSYFLRSVRLLHATITYPAILWDDMQKLDDHRIWLERLRPLDVGYVAIDKVLHAELFDVIKRIPSREIYHVDDLVLLELLPVHKNFKSKTSIN